MSSCPQCQIVCGFELSGVKVSAVSNCPRFQIVLVSNCPPSHFFGFQKQRLACFRGWDLLASVDAHNFLDDDYHDGDGFINDFYCGDGDDVDDDHYVHKSWPSLQRPN